MRRSHWATACSICRVSPVMGRGARASIAASECILQGLALVDDGQDGCVRFTAWAQGSALPRQMRASPFGNRRLVRHDDFGQPAYAQLLANGRLATPAANNTQHDPAKTRSPPAPPTARKWAPYARDKNPIRAQALLLKLQEIYARCLTPVIIDVT